MPGPHPARDAVLKHLRQSFPLKLDLDMGYAVYSHDQVHAAYEHAVEVMTTQVKEYGPDYLRVLRLYMFTPLSRTIIADMLDFDQSTVKRKEDAAADLILGHLHAQTGAFGLVTSKPDRLREAVLKSLRVCFVKRLPLQLGDQVFDFEDVRAAVEVLSNNGPDCVRVLRRYLSSQDSRATIAKRMVLDPSTVKRRLYVSVNMIMQYLYHYDFENEPLFAVTDPDTGEGVRNGQVITRSPLPVAFPYADRSNF